MPSSESVSFNGVVFRRYPNSPRRELSHYYTPSGAYRKRGVGRIHQEVWKFHLGSIPSGHSIHHRDGDTLNNDITNLECIPNHQHLSKHGQGRPPNRDHLARIRPLTVAWHQSEQGRAWHRAHAQSLNFGKVALERSCLQCQAPYTARNFVSTFCSNKCKSAWRRKSGVDNVEKSEEHTSELQSQSNLVCRLLL